MAAIGLRIRYVMGLITYCMIFAALAFGTYRQPSIALAAVLCLYGLKQWGQSTNAFLAEHREIANYAAALIAIFGVFIATVRRSCLFCQIPRVSILVGLLYLYALFSAGWAPDPQASLQQWITQGPYIATIVLVAPLLLSNARDVRTAFLATAITGGAICFLALQFGNWGFRGLVLYGDFDESETNPLALASMAGTALMVAAFSLSRENRSTWRIFSIACIPACVAVILKSGSRGQLLASGVALIAASPIYFRIRSLRSIGAMFLAAGVLVGLGWWASTLVEIDSARWSSTDSVESVSGRLELARALLVASTSHPLTALFGLGNSSSITLLGIYPHITGLEVLAEEGLIGAALYCSIIISAIRSIARASAALPEKGFDRQGLAILAGLFIFELLLSWKQGTLLSSVYVFAYAIMLGYFERNVADSKLAPALTSQAAWPQPPNLPNVMR